MKQLLQNLRSGELEIAELPSPSPGPGEVLIANRASLISSGTERMLVEFSQANLLAKAKQQPERVKKVLDKIKADGLAPTLEAVFRKLDQPLPLGYCSAGEVIAVGGNIHDLAPGDRVASNGGHAELVCVPRNLCARIPAGVGFDEAAFTVLASIALQGVRLAEPTLGETIMVFGLGLLGLLSCQLLASQGCRVIAVDLNTRRLALAESLGAIPVNISTGADPVLAARELTGGMGVDGALITAAAKNDQIIHQAAGACRKRGRLILVGVVDLNLRREDFYEKELSFQVSCSYGPGRYDSSYEQGGQDYPLAYVRWTEQRNFQAVLGLIARGGINPSSLISDRIPFERAAEAYEKIGAASDSLGIVLTYSGRTDSTRTIFLNNPEAETTTGAEGVGIIGAGNFALSTFLPALADTGASLLTVADLDPKSSRQAARKFGFARASTDYQDVLNDPNIGTVFILAGHNVHARLVMESLEAGKQTFVEKPLAMNLSELENITTLRNRLIEGGKQPRLMVGFNRRFSPHIHKIRTLLQGRSGPMCMSFTINAGYIPAAHWTQDPIRGGGRIIGEGCHFIDLLAYLAGAPIKTVSALQVGEGPETRGDKTAIILSFADGSIGTVNYFANGNRAYPKENMEIFCDGKVLRMENFRRTRGWGFPGFRCFRTRRQDKGHRRELSLLLEASTRGEPVPISFPELYNSTLASILAVESAREHRTIEMPEGN